MEELVTYEQLKKYDEVKGTAVVDIKNNSDFFPSSESDNKTYINRKTEKVYIKDIEVATEKRTNEIYIKKEEKAKASGVATLDENGRVPIEQMPVGTSKFIGVWDCTSGEYPSTANMQPGYYYRVSIAGKLTEYRNDIDIDPGEYLSKFEVEIINPVIDSKQVTLLAKVDNNNIGTVTKVGTTFVQFSNGEEINFH